MDCYEASFCTEYPPDDPTRLSVVANLGYTLDYAQRMNLAAMVPRSDLCSSQYCLANPAADGAEYLVYLPAGSIAETILGKVGLQNQNLDTVLARQRQCDGRSLGCKRRTYGGMAQPANRRGIAGQPGHGRCVTLVHSAFWRRRRPLPLSGGGPARRQSRRLQRRQRHGCRPSPWSLHAGAVSHPDCRACGAAGNSPVGAAISLRPPIRSHSPLRAPWQ